MEKLLTYSALVLYLGNYLIGWLLYFKRISMTKQMHQIFFTAIIINLTALFFVEWFSWHLLLALLCMTALPLGKNGGMYHRIISTVGLLSYIIYLVHK